jgi:hypothetical protein
VANTTSFICAHRSRSPLTPLASKCRSNCTPARRSGALQYRRARTSLASVSSHGRGFRFAVGGQWAAALLVLGLTLAVGATSPSSATTKSTDTTTATGVPQRLHVTQVSYGPKTGMVLVGSPRVVWVYGQSGRVTFLLNLTNKGPAPYNCEALQATQIPISGTNREYTSPSPWLSCTGPGGTIAPGSTGFITFFLPGNAHPAKDIAVRPYRSDLGRMVWSVAGCPTVPKSCLG